jgi:hypothetical protein
MNGWRVFQATPVGRSVGCEQIVILCSDLVGDDSRSFRYSTAMTTPDRDSRLDRAKTSERVLTMGMVSTWRGASQNYGVFSLLDDHQKR